MGCVIVHGTYAISPIFVLQGEKEAKDAPHLGSVAPFPPCYKVGSIRRLARQRDHGTTRLTTAVRDARRALSSALVASASDEYTPEKTIQYPGCRLA